MIVCDRCRKSVTENGRLNIFFNGADHDLCSECYSIFDHLWQIYMEDLNAVERKHEERLRDFMNEEN